MVRGGDEPELRRLVLGAHPVQRDVGDDLAEVLQAFRARIGLAPLAGALLFSGDARGRAMFTSPSHDVRAVRDELGLESVAGFFAAGEIGPLGGRNQVHGFTATVLAFGT